MSRATRNGYLLTFALLGTAVGWHLRITRPVEAGTATPPRAARALPQQETQTPAPAAPEVATVRIEVKPAVEAPDPDGEAAKACGIPAAAGSAPWARWAGLGGRRIHAKSSNEDVPVYAVRTPTGVVVLVANHAQREAALQLDIRVGRGVHTVERHDFALEPGLDPSRTEHLQSVTLKSSGSVAKPVRLHAGTATVFCVEDVCRELGRALQNARTALWALADSRPRSFRVIRAPFSEAAPQISEIVKQGGTAARARIVYRAERAMLSLAHAQTLCGNLRSSGSLGTDTGNAVGDALDRLAAGLSAVSAAMLDLVPNCEWADEEPGRPDRRSLTVQLSNYGSRSLRMVKIGVAVPRDCRVTPDEQAVFRAVRPGETVRATFMVQPASPDDLSAVRANMSYIANRAPTHLRIQTL